MYPKLSTADTIHINQSLALEWFLTTGMFKKSDDLDEVILFSEDCNDVFTAWTEISEGKERKIYVEKKGMQGVILAMSVENAQWLMGKLKEQVLPTYEEMSAELNEIENERKREEEAKDAEDWNMMCSVMQLTIS